MKVLLVSVYVLAVILNGVISGPIEKQNFKNTEQLHKDALLENLSQSQAHSKEYKQGVEGSTYFNYVPPMRTSNVNIPDSIDWRQKGAVTPVKSQHLLEGCWVPSALGALEGQFSIRTGKLVRLSEQNLIDCCPSAKSVEDIFQCVINEGGIDTEDSYPSSYDGQCHYNPKNSAGTISKYETIQTGNEDDLKVAVATIGPVAVAIDATNFIHYANGVFNDPNCNTVVLDHTALVVGYGTTDNGTDYWIVKNSWGESFGENGYIRMSRNKNNQCGIASYATYAIA